MNIDWGQVAAVITALAVGGSAVVVVARHMLRVEFVPRTEHAGLAKRLDQVESRMDTLPDKREIAEFARRLGNVETGVAVTATKIDGVEAGLKRVENMANLLVKHHLERGQ